MEKPIITLNGHDTKSKNTLVLISFDKKQVKYKLVTPFSNTLRCGSDSEDSHTIAWIDPSGGPMMKVGEFKVNDLLLNKIFHSNKYRAFILEFNRV
jgi:hypothetical protein